MNVMGLLAKFLVQPNIGEPSREICPEIAFGPVSVKGRGLTQLERAF